MHYTYLEFGRSLMSPGSGPSNYHPFTWDTYSAPTVNESGHGDRLVRVAFVSLCEKTRMYQTASLILCKECASKYLKN